MVLPALPCLDRPQLASSAYTVMGSSLALLALLRLQQVSEPQFQFTRLRPLRLAR
jgi:hypothetical protein